MAAYADGEIIEYTSHAPDGYSIGQVVRYAADALQDNPGNPLVIIRAYSGGEPFPVRETQLRHPAGDMSTSAAAAANWALSAEGIAACRAATEFAERAGINDTPSEVCAIVIAAHEAEEKMRRGDRP